MKRSIVETILGAIVVTVAAYFFAFSYSAAEVGTEEGYNISADFSGVGGLKAGDTVQISGVKIGAVTAVKLVPETYLARVHMNIEPGIELPLDTAAIISSESLLGGRYLSLEPGADEDFMEEGDSVAYTQAPQNLEELLGKFIFSQQSSEDDQ